MLAKLVIRTSLTAGVCHPFHFLTVFINMSSGYN